MLTDLRDVLCSQCQLESIIQKESSKTNVIVSELLNRNEIIEYSQKVKKVNITIAKVCKQYNWE